MSSISSAANQQPSKGLWAHMAPYVVPPVAASLAIVVVFRDMVAKSALQRGQSVPAMTLMESMKGGIKAAPTVGAIVGSQMIIQSAFEKVIVGESNTPSLFSTLVSSSVVGTASAPVLAVFNGQTMGWTIRESLRRFSVKQAVVISLQESAFVGGLSAADQLAVVMRERLGDNKVVDYVAAFTAGAAGSLAGHPANTALTRWQSGMTVDKVHQLMWGSLRKARGVGGFSVAYKFAKEIFNATFPSA